MEGLVPPTVIPPPLVEFPFPTRIRFWCHQVCLERLARFVKLSFFHGLKGNLLRFCFFFVLSVSWHGNIPKLIMHPPVLCQNLLTGSWINPNSENLAVLFFFHVYDLPEVCLDFMVRDVNQLEQFFCVPSFVSREKYLTEGLGRWSPFLVSSLGHFHGIYSLSEMNVGTVPIITSAKSSTLETNEAADQYYSRLFLL